MVLPKGIPTIKNTQGNYTRPDNVFCSAGIEDWVTQCTTSPGQTPPKADHFPIHTTVDFTMSKSERPQSFNYRAVEWDAFLAELIKNLEAIPEPRWIDDEEQFRKALQDVSQAIHDTREKIVPRRKPSPHSKRWWTKDLDIARSQAKRAGEKVYMYRHHPAHPSHEEARRRGNDYSELIKKTKRDFWMEWLEGVNAKSVWDANRFISAPGSDGGRTKIPALKEKVNGRIVWEVQDNAEKSRMLHAIFFKDPPAHEDDEGPFQYPEPAFKFEPIQDKQIHRAIRRLKPYLLSQKVMSLI